MTEPYWTIPMISTNAITLPLGMDHFFITSHYTLSRL